MYRGYLEIGGKELANTARLAAYLNALAPGSGFRPGIDIENLPLALGDPDYREPVGDDAPWVDSSNPASGRFYGLHLLDITGVEDGTGSADVTESIVSGGSVGRSRDTTKEMRAKVVLVGADDLAVDAGWTWLLGALKPDQCGAHGNACGGSDLCFFVAKPVVYPGMVGPDFELSETIDYFTVSSDADVVFRPADFAGPRRATWTATVVDGAQLRYGALALDSTKVLEQSEVIYLRRTNYLPNPRFADDDDDWTATDGTLTLAGSGSDTYARLDGDTPATYDTNWLPDPSFENGDPEVMGYRSTTPGGITRVVDGTAPNGTHVAVVDGVPGETMFEVTALGPVEGADVPDADTLSLSIALSVDDVVVEVFDGAGALVESHTILAATLGSAWNFETVALGSPVYAGYVIRFSTAGTQDLRVDALLLTSGSTTFFSGDTAAGGGSVYYFVGSDPSRASRKVTGTVGPYQVDSGNTTAPLGIDILSFSARAPYEASITVSLVDVDDNILGSVVVTPGQAWARYSVGVPNGLSASVRVTGSGPVDVTEFLYERGNDLLPYFDSGSATAEDYEITTVSGIARMDFVGTMVTERDTPEWRPFLQVLSENPIPRVTLLYESHAPVDLDECVAPYERRLHDVVCTSAPKKVREFELADGSWAREATFLLVAATPYMFSNPREVEIEEIDTAYFSDYARNLSTNPSGEAATTGHTAVPGTSGTAAITNPTSATAFGTKVIRSTWSVASTAAGGGEYIDVAVEEGYHYSFGWNHVKASIGNRLQLSVEWRTNVGTISTVTATAKQVVGGTLYDSADFKLEDQVAPATATIARVKVLSVAGTGYANWSIGSYLELDGLMVNVGPVLLPYFDGSSTDDDAYTYSWEDTTGLSVSRREFTVIDPPGELVDPNLPAIPAPPEPPFIPDPAVEDQPVDWLRYYYDIPASDVSGWAVTVPTVLLSTLLQAVRFVRFRITPNPFGYDADQVDPLAFCAEFILSYLPAATELTVDGAVQRAWAMVAGGQPQAAEQLLYATDGSPMTWPEMSCNIPYLLTIDVPGDSTIANLGVRLELTDRR